MLWLRRFVVGFYPKCWGSNRSQSVWNLWLTMCPRNSILSEYIGVFLRYQCTSALRAWVQNPWRFVVVASEFCTVASNICVSLVRNLLCITFLKPRHKRGLLDFRKILCTHPWIKSLLNKSLASLTFLPSVRLNNDYSNFLIVFDFCAALPQLILFLFYNRA
jgi:hypothetical protein